MVLIMILVNWNSGKPNQAGNKDCIEYFSTPLINDFPCKNIREKFTCYTNSSITNITIMYQCFKFSYIMKIVIVLNEFDTTTSDN